MLMERGKSGIGELLFGTVDTWLIWKLTLGKVHATDYSNASRTMLYNIRELSWDKKLLEALTIPAAMLPIVKSSSGYFGELILDGNSIPITGVAGDQQAALFGQACFEPGMAKNTYGTGCFMLMNTGEKLHASKTGLLTTIAWGIDGHVQYALEGSVFIAGAAVQWIRDGLKLIDSASDAEKFASQAGDANDVYVYLRSLAWCTLLGHVRARRHIRTHARHGKKSIDKSYARINGLPDQRCTRSHAKRLRNKIEKTESGWRRLCKQPVDAVSGRYSRAEVERPEVIESTALGAAYLAGIGVGLWKKEDIKKNRKVNKVFKPAMDDGKREMLYKAGRRREEDDGMVEGRVRILTRNKPFTIGC